jgi:transcriptional regulator with XRE-family HTH domain
LARPRNLLSNRSEEPQRGARVGRSRPPEEIGLEIRDLRRARQLTIKELAVATSLSIGHLSEIERGLASPSVQALHDIAEALGVNISWFFHNGEGNDGERDIVVRASNRRTLKFSSGITDELLSANLRGQLELLLSRFAPGASSGTKPYTHRGEEAGIVIRGSLELWVGERKFVLKEGDSFSFESTKPHKYSNPGDTETVVIWSITPPSY